MAKLLDVHLEAAVAIDIDHEAIGELALHAHRGGQAEAHRAEAAAREERARAVELVELGGPHLVLADADGDHRIAIVRELPQFADGVLLQDAGEVFVVVERFFLLPRLALLDPVGNVLGRFDDLVQLGERVLHVAAHGDVGRLVLVQLGGIDIDVDDLAVLAEFFDLAGDAVVEPHAEGDEQIGLFARRSSRTRSRACRACRAKADCRWGTRRGP